MHMRVNDFPGSLRDSKTAEHRTGDSDVLDGYPPYCATTICGPYPENFTCTRFVWYSFGVVYVVYKGKSEWKPVKAYCICSWCHESLWAELQYSRRCTQVWRPSG